MPAILKCMALPAAFLLVSCVSTARYEDATVVYTSGFLGDFREAHLQLPDVSLATPATIEIHIRDLPFAALPTDIQLPAQDGDVVLCRAPMVQGSLPWHECEISVSVASSDGTEIYARHLRLGESAFPYPWSVHPFPAPGDFGRRGERNYYQLSLFYPPYPIPESQRVAPLRSYNVTIVVQRPSSRSNDSLRLVGNAHWSGSEYTQIHDAVVRGGT